MTGALRDWMDAPTLTAVYDVRTPTGELLYVGYTRQPKERMRRHRNASLWWNLDVVIRFHWFPTPRRARAVERLVIELLRPPFNVAHIGGE